MLKLKLNFGILILYLFKLSKFTIFNNFKKQDILNETYYFSSLGDGNFCFDSKSNNVLTWFHRNFIKQHTKKPIAIIHSNKNYKKTIKYKNLFIQFKEFPYFNNNSIVQSNFLIFRSFKFLFIYIFNFFNSKYDFFFINIREILISFFSENNDLPYKKCFFNNSDYLIRPLWSYSNFIDNKVFFYFYSTNFFKRKLIGKKFRFAPGYNSMIWSNYIFWNKLHAKHFSKLK